MRLHDDGNAVACRRLGTPSGLPVVFFHGFLGSSEDWEPVARRLARHHECLLVDLPGHGRSRYQFPRHFTFPAFSDLLAGWLNANGWSRVLLVGYSMGGRLALYMTCRYPELVAGTVAESASPGLSSLRARRQRAREDAQWIKQLTEGDLRTFLARWYSQPVFRGIEQRPFFPAMFQRRLRNDGRELAKALALMGLARQPDLRPCLKTTKLPLLLVTGENDTKFQALAGELVQANPRIQWVTMPQCGHNTHAENPSQFAYMLDAFFKRIQRQEDNQNPKYGK